MRNQIVMIHQIPQPPVSNVTQISKGTIISSSNNSIYVTQSETRVDVRDVVKSEVEEPMMVTNQKTDAIDQSEPDGFHVENEPLVDAGQKIESEKVEIERNPAERNQKRIYRWIWILQQRI